MTSYIIAPHLGANRNLIFAASEQAAAEKILADWPGYRLTGICLEQGAREARRDFIARARKWFDAHQYARNARQSGEEERV